MQVFFLFISLLCAASLTKETSFLPTPISALTVVPSSSTTSPRTKISSRRNFGVDAVFSVSAVVTTTATLPASAQAEEQQPKKLQFVTTADGLKYADIVEGLGPAVTDSNAIRIHYKGRLVGKQGWFFDDTYATDDPIRIDLKADVLVEGFRRGIVGSTDADVGIGGMRVGGRRRIVVPSSLGYVDKKVMPIPKDMGQRRRLYSTVMNSNRIDREREALGGNDLAGVVMFDVELLRIIK